jgi:hypothetical protein
MPVSGQVPASGQIIPFFDLMPAIPENAPDSGNAILLFYGHLPKNGQSYTAVFQHFK